MPASWDGATRAASAHIPACDHRFDTIFSLSRPPDPVLIPSPPNTPDSREDPSHARPPDQQRQQQRQPAQVPQCKHAPINKKEGTCRKCDSKSYCSQACVALDRRHRLECPRLAFDYVINRFRLVETVGPSLLRQGRYEEADQLYRKVMAVGETSLGFRQGDVGELSDSAHRVGLLFLDAVAASMQLLDFEEAKARLERGMAIYEDVRHQALRTQYRTRVQFNLGLLLTNQGKHEEAEPFYRAALGFNRKAQELFDKRPPSDPFKDPETEVAKNLMVQISDSFFKVLHQLGKEEELRAMYEAHLRPVWVRQLLAASGYLTPTPAQIEGFGVEQAMACPLSDVKTIDLCWQWATAELMTGHVSKPTVMPLRLRLLQRLKGLVGPADACLAMYARIMLVEYGETLPLQDLLTLYQQQARPGRREAGDVAAGCDAASLTGIVAQRVAREGMRTHDEALYPEWCRLLRQAVEEAEAVDEAYPGLVLRWGELGHMLMCEGEVAEAKQAFEKAISAAQEVWGKEGEDLLLGKGMDVVNHTWLSAYLQLLEDERVEDEAGAARRKWLTLLQAELEGRDEELGEAALSEIRVAMRRARGADPVPADDDDGGAAGGEGAEGGGVGMGRRARLRLAARRRAAAARLLKRARASVRGKAEAAAADAAVAAVNEEKEQELTDDGALCAAGESVAEQEGEDEEEVEEEELNECAICLLDLEIDERETLAQCGHAFHWKCIGEWRNSCRKQQRPNTCPYCRAVI